MRRMLTHPPRAWEASHLTVPKTDPEPSARVPVPRGAAIFAGGGLLLAITALLIANGGGGESPSVRLSVQVPDLLLWAAATADRKSTRLNSSHLGISYAVFCLK